MRPGLNEHILGERLSWQFHLYIVYAELHSQACVRLLLWLCWFTSMEVYFLAPVQLFHLGKHSVTTRAKSQALIWSSEEEQCDGQAAFLEFHEYILALRNVKKQTQMKTN